MKIAGHDVTVTKDSAQVGCHRVTRQEVADLLAKMDKSKEQKWPRYFRCEVGRLWIMLSETEGDFYEKGKYVGEALPLYASHADEMYAEITAEEADKLIVLPKDTPPPQKVPVGYEWTGEFRRAKDNEPFNTIPPTAVSPQAIATRSTGGTPVRVYILRKKDTPPPEKVPSGYEWTGEYRAAKKGEEWLSEEWLINGCVITASTDYRPTPENRCYILRKKEPRYRPWKPEDVSPTMRIRHKEGGPGWCAILLANTHEVWIVGTAREPILKIDYHVLLDEYEQLDGTPAGVKE